MPGAKDKFARPSLWQRIKRFLLGPSFREHKGPFHIPADYNAAKGLEVKVVGSGGRSGYPQGGGGGLVMKHPIFTFNPKEPVIGQWLGDIRVKDDCDVWDMKPEEARIYTPDGVEVPKNENGSQSLKAGTTYTVKIPAENHDFIFPRLEMKP